MLLASEKKIIYALRRICSDIFFKDDTPSPEFQEQGPGIISFYDFGTCF
jgi:hypothetical protein